VVFAVVGRGGSYYGRGGFAVPAIATSDCAGPCGGIFVPQPQEPSELLILGGFGSGTFASGRIQVEHADDASWSGFWGSPSVYAHGTRALLVSQSDAAVIDAGQVSSAVIAKRVPLIAYPSFVDLRDTTALLTLGAQGVQWVSLD
jgi:hypothetical protein